MDTARLSLHVAAFTAATLGVVNAHAEFVLPAIGGDQVMMPRQRPDAPVSVRMKHADVGFDGQSLTVHIDDTVPTPRLRTLSPPSAFDPAAAWSVLTGTHHNAQYGWNPAITSPLPDGLGVFVESLSATPGLRVYEGGRFMSPQTIQAMPFTPLFADGSPWHWASGQMTHHFFAVEDPAQGRHEATYRVFLADEMTGIEPMRGGVPLYGSATATFRFIAVPEPSTLALLVGAIALVNRRRRGVATRRTPVGSAITCAAAVAFVAGTTPSGAEYVQPLLGGGSVSEAGASMKHAFVRLRNNQVEVTIDPAIPLPRLRPLIEPAEFDPARPEAVLNGSAYNAQYGWLLRDLFSLPPAGKTYWMTQVDASPGLRVYQRPPELPAFAPIFGTDGSSATWQWSTSTMVHNWYAVADHTSTQHWADYEVFVADAAGNRDLSIAPAITRFWFADPGDLNEDEFVTAADGELWRASYGLRGSDVLADANADGAVNAADYTVWRDRLAAAAVAVPEPQGLAIAAAAIASAAPRIAARSGER